jgi:hypothetical protein
VKATQILNWVRRDFHRYAGDEHIDILESSDTKVRLKLYSDVNQYLITAECGEREGTLSAEGFSRKPRAGEHHTRGSDLHYGFFCEETWELIKNDIISYELVRIRKRIPR